MPESGIIPPVEIMTVAQILAAFPPSNECACRALPRGNPACLMELRYCIRKQIWASNRAIRIKDAK